jgi:MFS family permease
MRSGGALRIPRLLANLVPPTALERKLTLQSILSAFATGSFLTGTAVFFTHIVGLSAAQVGLGMSASGIVVLLLSVPLGKLADRVGAQRMWILGAIAEAALYFVWPWLSGFVAFLVMLSVLAVVETGARAGRDAYRLQIFPPATRVRSLAFMRSARNIGYTLGAASGGFALAIGTDTAIKAVPVLTGVLLVINAAMVSRLPALESEKDIEIDSIASPAGLHNRGFVILGLCNGILGTNQILLNVVVPLWLVERTDAPHTLLAWLFGTNTVLAVLLQVRFARGANSVPGALRAARLSAWCFVISCAIIAVTHDTVGWVSIVLIWAGHVTITGAELWSSAAGWGWVAELSDPQRMGEYQGVWNLGYQVESIAGPATFTFLAINWGTLGWGLIALIAVTASAVAHPAARAAERHLQAHLPVPPRMTA